MSDRLTSSQRSARARIGAYRVHSQYDSRELTKPAREKFNERWVNEVDPDRTLPEAERMRRADHAKKAYFVGLAFKSAQARKRGAR